MKSQTNIWKRATFNHATILAAIILGALFLSFNLTSAQPLKDTVHTQLLTVQEDEGGIADLYLTIKPGSGSVFLETQPLTKLDTQISTRFANDLACKYANIDCKKYDFFYRIRADSTTVGGPSASAPIALITYATLTGREMNPEVIMTGTINPGGLIGSVDGIQEKILAARQEGYSKVLIPMLSTYNLTDMNAVTEDIQIIEVATFDEVLYHTLGIPVPENIEELKPTQEYVEIMQNIAEELCNRTKELNATTTEFPDSLKQAPENKTQKAIQELENMNYYSAASLCFGANVDLRKLQLSNHTQSNLRSINTRTADAVQKLERQLESRQLKSLPELETYAIVRERLQDAKDSLSQDGILIPLLANTTQNVSYEDTAYAVERYHSAIAWSQFFKLKGTEYNIDEAHLKEGCSRMIDEAQSRLDYAELYFPFGLDDAESGLDNARADYKHQEYALCIFTASKAKADASVILSGISVSREKMDKLIDIKQNVSAKVIQDQIEKGNFPILGYSYYEYTGVLQEQDPFLALTFGEYALEFSNLDMYFPKKQAKTFTLPISTEFVYGFAGGLIAGLIGGFVIKTRHGKQSKSNKKRNKR